ncbi:mitochondrial substrate carrier family protein ucpB [Hordeum vulgare]|nr:mitochondrial substrate carrier family protein ucpB [Hordeum vulgare]
MASPMSGDARTPPRGAAPYALYQFGTSGAAVAVATAATHPLGQPIAPARSVYIGLGLMGTTDLLVPSSSPCRFATEKQNATNEPLLSGPYWIMVNISKQKDVIKIRLQMQLAGQRGNLVGMGAIFKQMVEREGPRSLYLGFAPALTRSLIYGGLRLGLCWCPSNCIDNPMEVLKVRSQMSTSRISTIGVMKEIVSEEGVKALWKGVGPAMVRAGCLTASQMATYDEAKQVLLMWTPFEEGFQLHLMSSCIAGTAGTLVTAPIDMIKTRLMLQRESKGARVYRNGFHCAYQWVCHLRKVRPQTAITFVACEKLRELAGMSAI